ncbi:hypothetical protein DPMN_028567 [Dreissena polymorpha]|uniref:Uncharacterized protein n=1 Tax=Dreissena polymorpha TaxID=45954 RepID=A0A9D4LXJ0_DREPO|nr:hypothetical protein DPMN_028567 [Dreissena polymorpha]
MHGAMQWQLRYKHPGYTFVLYRHRTLHRGMRADLVRTELRHQLSSELRQSELLQERRVSPRVHGRLLGPPSAS